MSWRLKAVVILALALLLAGTLWMGFAVYARYQGNEYVLQLSAAFNAAALVNGEETFTEPEKAVISAYEGRRYVVLPENYRAIVSLLRRNSAMPPFRRVGRDAPLSITVCDSTAIRLRPDTEDGALVCLTTDGGREFTMHVRGGNIWKQILEYAVAGHSENRNIELGGAESRE